MKNKYAIINYMLKNTCTYQVNKIQLNTRLSNALLTFPSKQFATTASASVTKAYVWKKRIKVLTYWPGCMYLPTLIIYLPYKDTKHHHKKTKP